MVQSPHNHFPRGRLAQLGERLPYKQEVTGSSPVPPIDVNALQSGTFAFAVSFQTGAKIHLNLGHECPRLPRCAAICGDFSRFRLAFRYRRS
jgi:hypothetical protein